MNNMEKLALSTALEKALKDMNNPKNPDSLRYQMDEKLKEDYCEDGTDRRKVMINGQPVGTYSLTFTKEVDGLEPVVDNYDLFAEWFSLPENLGYLHQLVNKCLKDALSIATSQGELPDGVVMRQVTEPPRVKGTTLRVDKEKLQKALGNQLESSVMGLLAAGDQSI